MRSQAAAEAQVVLWRAKPERRKRENSHSCKRIWLYHHSFMSPKCPIRTDWHFSWNTFSPTESQPQNFPVCCRKGNTAELNFVKHIHTSVREVNIFTGPWTCLLALYWTIREACLSNALFSHAKCHSRHMWWPPCISGSSSPLATKLVWDDCNFNLSCWVHEMNLAYGCNTDLHQGKQIGSTGRRRRLDRQNTALHSTVPRITRIHLQHTDQVH